MNTMLQAFMRSDTATTTLNLVDARIAGRAAFSVFTESAMLHFPDCVLNDPNAFYPIISLPSEHAAALCDRWLQDLRVVSNAHKDRTAPCPSLFGASLSDGHVFLLQMQLDIMRKSAQNGARVVMMVN